MARSGNHRERLDGHGEGEVVRTLGCGGGTCPEERHCLQNGTELVPYQGWRR
jgi:hypothetical protein